MVQRFAVEAVNDIQPLTAEGANYGVMGMQAFEPEQPAVSLAKPALNIGGIGGPQ